MTILCFVSVKPRILQLNVWCQKNDLHYDIMCGTSKQCVLQLFVWYQINDLRYTIMCGTRKNNAYYNFTFGTIKTTYVMELCVVQ